MASQEANRGEHGALSATGASVSTPNNVPDIGDERGELTLTIRMTGQTAKRLRLAASIRQRPLKTSLPEYIQDESFPAFLSGGFTAALASAVSGYSTPYIHDHTGLSPSEFQEDG